MENQNGLAMSDQQTTVFDLFKEEINVSLKEPGSNSPRECVLREMDGFQRDTYLNSQRNKLDKASNSVKDFLNVQASLIAQCLYEKNSDAPIPQSEIQKFPAKVQTGLYNICMKLNGFDAGAEAEAKNS